MKERKLKPIDAQTIQQYVKAKATFDQYQEEVKQRVMEVAEILDSHRALCCDQYWEDTYYQENNDFWHGGAVLNEGISSFEFEKDEVKIFIDECEKWGQPCKLPSDEWVYFSFPVEYLFDNSLFAKEAKELEEFLKREEEIEKEAMERNKEAQRKRELAELEKLKAKYEG